MRKLNKAFKLLLCASLACSIGISATACNVNNEPTEPEDPDGPVFVPPSQDASEGVDWSKYWDGVSNVPGTDADNFKFDQSKDIGTITGDYSPDTEVAAGEQCIVRFSDGVSAQSVESGNKAVKPEPPSIDGKMFVNWYTDGTYKTKYDFNSPVTSDLNLVAKWENLDGKIQSVTGYNESLAVVWEDANPSSAAVRYKKTDGAWQNVEKPLIRSVDGYARVDVVGLAAGEYEVEITASGGNKLTLPAPVTVDAYDRSGYAHFGYDEGVGAYTDNGTLKQSALVIYLTENTKNTVNEGYVNGVKTDLTPYLTDSSGTAHKGIGEILNNRRYAGNDRADVGIARLCKEFGAVTVRVLGKISCEIQNGGYASVVGLTNYAKKGDTNPETGATYDKGDPVPNGGTVGDNGMMARMVNAKNLTIEGIGNDACISGWGFHFISSRNGDDSVGKSFEVRNLTFENYPEDAIGFEGEQAAKKADANLNSPIERCWVHNNTFYPGHCANPAESDKAEGDGSCDFKRGRYFTLAYNYFTDCHKTNLIGSASTSIQYCVTMHHNMWDNCGSRIPLVRAANVHFYNNYVYGDASAAGSSLSYVHSSRANSYIFSESNYYDGCKQIFGTGEGGGAIKSYKNTFVACFNEETPKNVINRTVNVPNNCKYTFGKVDYATFDTNKDLFYYNETEKTSDCLLDDATGARLKVLTYVGAQDFTPDIPVATNKLTPQNAVTVPDNGTLNVDFTGVKAGSTVNNVLFNAGLSSGAIKGKGQLITFTLSAPAQVTVTTVTTGYASPDIYDSYGKVWVEGFNNSVSIKLPAGTYVISAGQKDKEASITSLSFADSGASSEYRINAAKAALAAIPSTVTLNSESVISEATKAYGALIGEERNNEDIIALYPRYAKATEALALLQVAYVIARIDYIGEVTQGSYNKINAAQIAYMDLPPRYQSQITNYNVLTAAWSAYEAFAAQNVINKLLDLPDLTSSEVKIHKREALDKLKDWFNAVDGAYNALTSDSESTNQQAVVRAHEGGKTYKKLTDGLAEIEQIEKLFDFKDELDAAKIEDAEQIGGRLNALYNSLTDAQKATVTGESKAKFDEIMEKYAEVASKKKVLIFNEKTGVTSDGDFWTFKGTFKDGSKATINGTEYTGGLKFDKNGAITFTSTAKMTLKVYFTLKSKIALDGDASKIVGVSEGDHYVGTITVEAGTHTLSKGKDGESAIFMVELTPAN